VTDRLCIYHQIPRKKERGKKAQKKKKGKMKSAILKIMRFEARLRENQNKGYSLA